MKWLALPIVALLAHHAAANECNERQSQATSSDVPLGCPITVYAYPAEEVPMEVSVLHGGQDTTIPATITESSDEIQVEYDDIDNECVDHYERRSRPYSVFTISDFDASVGDQVGFDGAWVWITEAAPCPAVIAPEYFCSSPAMTCDPVPAPEPQKELDGCNTGGASGFGTIFMIGIALLGRRRSRRR